MSADPGTLQAFAQVLEATGPYGLVAVLGWAFWLINDRKDRELKALSHKVVAMAEAQTAAIAKVEAALLALKAAIDDLRQARR